MNKFTITFSGITPIGENFISTEIVAAKTAELARHYIEYKYRGIISLLKEWEEGDKEEFRIVRKEELKND